MSAAKVLHRKWKFGTKIKDDENMVKWWKWSVLKCHHWLLMLTYSYCMHFVNWYELCCVLLGQASGAELLIFLLWSVLDSFPNRLVGSWAKVSPPQTMVSICFNAERCRTFENGQAASQSICTVCTCFNQVDKLGETWWKCSNDFQLRPRVFHNAVLRSC